MICYPLNTLINAGIEDIMIVSGKGHVGHFLELLGSGSDMGIRLSYEIQEGAGGIAQALGLTRRWSKNDSVIVVLGDNIFEDSVKAAVQSFKCGARIFLKEVPDARRFGVAEISGDNIIGIEEKPQNPKSNFAVTGLYIYDHSVFGIIQNLVPSNRGELEITDVNNAYIKKEQMTYSKLEGFWSDAGTFDSLIRAGLIVQQYRKAGK